MSEKVCRHCERPLGSWHGLKCPYNTDTSNRIHAYHCDTVDVAPQYSPSTASGKLSGAPVENPKEAAGRAKVPLHLCPPEAKRLMALALEDGAKKYGAWNWRDAGIQLTTYIGAMQRHLDAIADGEDVDFGSGLNHIAHILAGAAIVADAAKFGKLNDDRHGAAAEMEIDREPEFFQSTSCPDLGRASGVTYDFSDGVERRILHEEPAAEVRWDPAGKFKTHFPG